ncbi:MAG: multicopper oxidase family protein [Proteobacteria bacterium]|nr:multicopper oxidase family protein [Pseudomonadota bacterium]
MTSDSQRMPTRRAVMQAAGGAAFGALLPWSSHSTGDASLEFRLRAEPARVPLVGAPHPDTDVWCYSGTVPGPEIRARQNDRLRILVENRLSEETTVHWHGVRLPNAMDGVPHLTQKPIAPGESFTYEFDLPDAGTFWYHPHQRSFEQVGRGLYGALIVEEHTPIRVDRDVTWVLGDWRLQPNAGISPDFGNFMDMAMSGRIGNTVTINGRLPDRFHVKAGERLRLRLINAANARIFGLEFSGHRPRIVALDGQPVEPHEPDSNRVVLGPAMRIDLIIDMTGRPGARFSVVDGFYRSLEYNLVNIVYSNDAPLRTRPLDKEIKPSANPLPEPDLETAIRHEVKFGGGMMGGMGSGGMGGSGMMGGMMGGGMSGQMHAGIWTVNGVSASGHIMEPMLTMQRNRSYVLALHNDTAWYHPIHLHGHSFRVISRNGRPTPRREWQDTVLIPPRERAEIAFVADNPGDWMIHCHILEHQESGMMGVFRVT